ncbi:nucleotidyl transferase AbiEii/AbiGii toxin family protein [Chitinophaga sp. XS-30]|uniref:nucleotidyl transferase AbiEii/AbiGii toxin family protein n=1 Tax=Chitinophaga sp. XS-30 TaxID=2604421 RepID=UPI0011DD2A9E|nr:nucleotidyl transferase AbiEii/AbiGii toxin family protein [Chitinophaga sp. XS-30]QEH43807.1 nucleotidyl transferase AbiEii/AbiGii toxin family protein [Chitinophaga sp. XS-30]
MIKEWLESYNPANREEATSALREIMQEVGLAGLYRSGFFDKAAFYGGTALRIFYGLDRFSEDLDFSLLEEDAGFSFQPYMQAIISEFNAQGMQVSINEKVKSAQSNVESAFLKSETIWKELVLDSILPEQHLGQVARIKIKIEVDKKPPLGFATEEKLLTRPFSFYVKCFSLPDLFAGKMHALLFRKWQNNVKGRDWYDMEWYIRNGTPLNLSHFLLRAKGSGNWQEEVITEAQFRSLLKQKIDSVNMDRVKDGIRRFIRHPERLDVWSARYFHDLSAQLKLQA